MVDYYVFTAKLSQDQAQKFLGEAASQGWGYELKVRRINEKSYDFCLTHFYTGEKYGKTFLGITNQTKAFHGLPTQPVTIQGNAPCFLENDLRNPIYQDQENLVKDERITFYPNGEVKFHYFLGAILKTVSLGSFLV